MGVPETSCQVAISSHWWCRGLRQAGNSWPQLVHLKRWHLSSSNSTCVVGRQARLCLNTWCMAENAFESQMSKFQTTDLWGKCWSQKPKKKKKRFQDSSLVQELLCVVGTFTRSQCWGQGGSARSQHLLWPDDSPRRGVECLKVFVSPVLGLQQTVLRDSAAATGRNQKTCLASGWSHIISHTHGGQHVELYHVIIWKLVAWKYTKA